MKSILLLRLVGAAAPLFAAPVADEPSPLVRRVADPALAVPNRFIVLLEPGASVEQVAAHHSHVRRMALRKRGAREGAAGGNDIDRAFRIGDGFNSYVGDFDDATAEEIARLPGVVSVEQDFVIKVEPTTSGPAVAAVEPRALQTQAGAPWHLGDISHKERGAGDYVFDDEAGEGSHVYVLDTGIRASHVEFGGRVRFGINGLTGSTTPPVPSEGDKEGHGTHCAGLAAGATYGVAKNAQIVDVKVFSDQGYGTASSIITGLNWAVNDIISRNIQKKAVLSMSLGSPHGASPGIEAATVAAYNLGVTPVCAAGNEDMPASRYSPARIPECITVGMTNSARNRSAPSPGIFGSNYGPEVDIFGPGQDVVAAGITSDTVVVTKGGTSMATPVVAGVVAYLRSVETDLDTPDQVRSRLIELSIKDIVGDAKGSANCLVNNNSGK